MPQRNSAVRWTADAHRDLRSRKWNIQHLACCALLLPVALLALYWRPACLQWHYRGSQLSPDMSSPAFPPSHIQEYALDAPRPGHLAASSDYSCMCMLKIACRQNGTKVYLSDTANFSASSAWRYHAAGLDGGLDGLDG